MKKNSAFALLFFLLIYFLNFFVASKSPGFPYEEALGSSVILGVFFFAIAYFLVRKNSPIDRSPEFKQSELLILTGIFLFVSVSLIFGNKIITAWLPDSLQDSLAENEIITLIRKVLIFVLIPFFIYKFLLGFKWKDFGFSSNTKEIVSFKNILVFVVMSSLFILLQWFGGSQAEPIRSGMFSSTELIFGMPLAFLWLLIEVGLVEEFFFRALIQDRISVLTKSTSWSIVIASLLFGLAHAPGMYFRQAGVFEGLGADPSFVSVVSYCIAVQATAGLPFAIIWSKTRNLWLLMAIHAAGDLISSYSQLMDSFLASNK